MPLYKAIWNLPTELAVYKGAFLVWGDDEQHAIDRAKESLGQEGDIANWRTEAVEGMTYEIGRSRQFRK